MEAGLRSFGLLEVDDARKRLAINGHVPVSIYLPGKTTSSTGIAYFSLMMSSRGTRDKYSSSQGMILLFGVGLVRSLKVMQTRSPGLIHSRMGLEAIGVSSA
jgi:hypothetical protein